jgi:hypothetical protein
VSFSEGGFEVAWYSGEDARGNEHNEASCRNSTAGWAFVRHVVGDLEASS